jgi:L-gulonate 5-dehydrogenase
MKALRYKGKGKLAIENIPKPRIKADEVLLKVKSVGICGTDLHIYHGGTDVKTGTIIGHEFSGVIEEIGKNVTNVKKSSRVVAEHVVTCRVCYYCLRGKPNLCVKAQVLGMHLPGALQEYMVVPARLVYPIPATISFEEAALIEPLTVALFAASSAGFLLEKTVAVIGQGPIGALLDQVLTAAGATVIGIDVLPSRLAFIKKKQWARALLNASDKQFLKKLRSIAPLDVSMPVSRLSVKKIPQSSRSILRGETEMSFYLESSNTRRP